VNLQAVGSASCSYTPILSVVGAILQYMHYQLVTVQDAWMQVFVGSCKLENGRYESRTSFVV
jgi:hypothetical protein